MMILGLLQQPELLWPWPALRDFLLVLSVYLLGVGGVHYAHHRTRRRCKAGSDAAGSNPKHIILVTCENQTIIEWVMRSLHLYALLKGKDIHMTVLDRNSQDDTLAIVEKMAVKLQWNVCIHRLSHRLPTEVLQNEVELLKHADTEVIQLPAGTHGSQQDLPQLP